MDSMSLKLSSRPSNRSIANNLAADLGYTPIIQVSEPWTVEKVIAKIPKGSSIESKNTPLAFFHILERLKTTKREGWRRFGISR